MPRHSEAMRSGLANVLVIFLKLSSSRVTVGDSGGGGVGPVPTSGSTVPP